MRVHDKAKEIEKYLEQLKSFLPSDFDTYEKEFKDKAACERYFEKIVEAVIDLSFLLVREERLGLPEEEEGVFVLLLNHKIISEELCKNLKDMKGMRNILVHEYGSVDDKIVFRVVTEEIEKDIRKFLESIEEYHKKKEETKEKE